MSLGPAFFGEPGESRGFRQLTCSTRELNVEHPPQTDGIIGAQPLGGIRLDNDFVGGIAES